MDMKKLIMAFVCTCLFFEVILVTLLLPILILFPRCIDFSSYVNSLTELIEELENKM